MNYSQIDDCVADLYEDYKIGTYGFDLFKIATERGIDVVPYSSFGKNREKFIRMDPDAFSFFNPKTQKPEIFYNEASIAKARMKFTLAHEIGHIVLRHVFHVPSSSMEEEANVFARSFYLPQIILVRRNIDTIPLMVEKFGISSDYAKVIFTLLEKRKFFHPEGIPFTPSEERLYSAFCKNESDLIRKTKGREYGF